MSRDAFIITNIVKTFCIDNDSTMDFDASTISLDFVYFTLAPIQRSLNTFNMYYFSRPL